VIAGLARKSGYREVRVMVAGEPGWVRAGYATYASRDVVRDHGPLLIDLRDRAADRTGRIPGSVSVPLAFLETAAAEIPARAPVVLYGTDDDQARQGLKILRSKGLGRVSLLEGNLAGWLGAGGILVKGPVRTTITWQKKPAAGEVSLADFRNVMAGRSDALLLDVRTNEETAAGLLPGARHIPLEHLLARMDELPRNKKIFIYCASGPRAEMASRLLAGKGFACRYLDASVRCAGGRCEVKE